MCCFDTRPWKLPAPFVGLVFRGFLGLMVLAHVNAVYERLEILRVAALFIFFTNSALIGSIFAMIATFCAQRWRNHFFSADVKVFCLAFALLWGMVAICNFGTILTGFIVCHAPGYQHEAESKYCHFFGNRKMAQIPDWRRTAWPVYYWFVITFTLFMAGWQTISWLRWFARIKDILRRRASTANEA